MASVLDLARPDILRLTPYQHAVWDASLERMHANEMPWRAQGDNTPQGLNRYPEPQPRALIERLALLYGVPPERILAGRGSDEAIDLLGRAFCRAGQAACATALASGSRWPGFRRLTSTSRPAGDPLPAKRSAWLSPTGSTSGAA